MNETRRPVLVTGASSGIGLHTCVELAKSGFRVIATMRDPAKADRLRQQTCTANGPVEVLPLDVTSPSSVASCAREVLQRHGSLYGLVNNAGIGIGGFFEDLTQEEIRENFETNFFGALSVIRAFVGPMREAGRGHIVNVTSVNGLVANAGMSAYTSSKFALEGFSETLYHELKPHGIHVSLVEPGMFRTEIFESNLRLCKRSGDQASPYYRRSQRLLANVKAQFEARAADPKAVSAMIARVLEHPNPALRYPVGTDAALAVFLKWLLPERLFLKLIDWAAKS